jgi:hypothetical protein
MALTLVADALLLLLLLFLSGACSGWWPAGGLLAELGPRALCGG